MLHFVFIGGDVIINYGPAAIVITVITVIIVIIIIIFSIQFIEHRNKVKVHPAVGQLI
jgi:heme/copper-type cytochrome/quinol oxidase subunit 2